LNGVDVLLYRSVDVNTWQISHIVAKRTNFKWGTFSVLNSIETLQNYFTCELLPDYLGSKVTLHFNVN